MKKSKWFNDPAAQCAPPEPPKYSHSVQSKGRNVSLHVESAAKRSGINRFGTEYTCSKYDFEGPLADAREYRDALNIAIEEASRLEGAVASIYGK